MAYLALYRQYRPRTFDEVLGQDVITRTLKNQIKSGRFAHAYLFCGSRGTGKTSTAKILARAINCQSPDGGNPCGHCEICQMPDAALSSDIIEIDAASNNGVDEIRELRDKIRYGPAIAKYKVYIIDEVHMLSMGAFNALLKTLEEPPEHAVFILATTEMHKLPATIISRCQRFDFLQLDEATILRHMQHVLADLNRTADEDALMCIANAAEGGMRDALSILDQCLMITDHLTLYDVHRAIGYVSGSSVHAFLAGMDDGDIPAMLNVIESVYKSGANLSVFVRACMQEIRDRLVHAKSDDSQARYGYAMEVLAPLQGQMRYATRPRVLLDAAAVRLCIPRGEDSHSALMARLEALEQKLAQIESQREAERTQGGAVEQNNAQAERQRAKAVPQSVDTGAPPFEEDIPPWDDAAIAQEEDEKSPWDEPPIAEEPPAQPARARQTQKAVSEKTGSAQKADAPAGQAGSVSGDIKSEFLTKLGKADAGVSQSLRLCKCIVRHQNMVYIAFSKGDEIFVDALRQHLQDLTRIAGEAYGEDVGVKVVTEDQVPKAPIDTDAVVQKAQEIFGVPVEIQET